MDWESEVRAANYWASLVLRQKRICLQCRSPGHDPWTGKASWRREWLPLQYSCQENSMDRGAWRATVHGVAKSLT